MSDLARGDGPAAGTTTPRSSVGVGLLLLLVPVRLFGFAGFR